MEKFDNVVLKDQYELLCKYIVSSFYDTINIQKDKQDLGKTFNSSEAYKAHIFRTNIFAQDFDLSDIEQCLMNLDTISSNLKILNNIIENVNKKLEISLTINITSPNNTGTEHNTDYSEILLYCSNIDIQKEKVQNFIKSLKGIDKFKL